MKICLRQSNVKGYIFLFKYVWKNILHQKHGISRKKDTMLEIKGFFMNNVDVDKLSIVAKILITIMAFDNYFFVICFSFHHFLLLG